MEVQVIKRLFAKNMLPGHCAWKPSIHKAMAVLDSGLWGPEWPVPSP